MLAVGVAFSLSAQDASFYRRYADRGDREAMYNLARCYFAGVGGVQEDSSAGTYWLTKSVKKNYAPAQSYLAYCYMAGVGVMKDYKQAYRLAIKASNQNDAWAKYLLATMYQYGMYVQKSNWSYMRYLRSSAGAGFAMAQTELGKLYLHGNTNLGVSISPRLAVDYFKKAAEQNDGEALLQLGLCYKEGIGGLPKDFKKAFEYTKQSADAGCEQGMYETGMDYLQEIGTDKDFTEAFRYISAAAERNVVDAYEVLGDIYSLTAAGDAENSAKYDADAVRWYQKAVDAHRYSACSSLAWMYLVGRGVAQNESKAYSLYRQAAEADDAGGYAGLGMCYEEGYHVVKDISKAVDNYKKAADNGNNYSQYRLYRIYRNGDIGVSKNTQMALKYLRMAADDNYNDALYFMGAEFSLGEIVYEEQSVALKYWTKAADNGSCFVCGVLGTMYYSGTKPCTKDYNKAFKYLVKAIDDMSSMSDDLKAGIYRCLGACYRFGRGTEVNHSLASYYTERAAELGDTGSFDAVKMLRAN